MNSPAADPPDELQNDRGDLDATRSMSSDDQASQLANVLDRYLADLQAGHQPDRQKLLAEHPDLASQLESCLSGIEFIHRASSPLPLSGTPTQLGDFRILREVGRGGMGVVYEAEQVSLKRRVALKVLRFGAAADTEAMQRFQREAETVAGLHHTNIVPIFAIGSEQGVNYYAMQFIEGHSLAEELKEARRESSKVAAWGLQAAEALAHAHQRGVVHRDIKPSNLILDPDGQLWLTDFGLAKRLDDVTLSMAGAILGTPRYMSPEQASSLKHPVDHRTDLYSLGATLYELVTGRPVFDADTAHGVITQILTAVPPAPRLIRPDVPRDFETIILKCLAKEPSQRYATAQALADDLRAFVEGRAIKARRATLAEQAARWFKQQKRSVGIAAVAVAATIAVVVGSLIAWQMHGQSRLGYLTLNTPREGEQRAEVAEVLSLDDVPVIAPFTLPTKEPLALSEGAYRLRLTAPSKVSQTYLFDIAAGASVTHDIGLVNETVGYAIPLRSPGGVEVVQSSRHAPRDESRTSAGVVRTNDASTTNNADPAHGFPHAERDGYFEPRLYVGPQDASKPTMRCYSVRSQPQELVVQEGSSINGLRSTDPIPLWEASWSLESPDVISLLKLPADREAWKVLPAQWDVQAWQQVLAWFDPWWFRNGSPPKVMQPARDLNGDGVEDVIWSAPQLSNPASGAIGPGPLTPKAAVLVAASGKDGKPLWWFRPQDSAGSASRLLGQPIWCGEAIVAVMRSAVTEELWIEAVSPQTGESLWRQGGMSAFAPGTTVTLRTSQGLEQRTPTARLTEAPWDDKPVVIAVIGNQLLVLDAATGEPRRPVQVLPRHAYSARFVDLDADGFPEALLTFMGDGGSPKFVAFSVSRGEPLWDTKVPVDSYRFQQTFASLPWPFVTDLDGDGRPEVVLPSDGESGVQAWIGCRVLEGTTGKTRWERRFPIRKGYAADLHRAADEYAVGPDLNGDGQRELFTVSVRREYQIHVVGQSVGYQREQYFLYVDCFSGRDGQSMWWQRIPLGMSEFSKWTGDLDAPILWQRDERGWPKLVLPVRRHADQGGDGIGNAGARLLFVLSAETGRVEHSAEHLAFPSLVDWNNDGLDDLAVFVPDDQQQFANGNHYPDRPSGKFVVLRGSPPEAFRRLGRWVEEQDFDCDGFAELSQRYHGNGDYAVQIASGRDGHIASKWQVKWPETPRTFTVGDLHSFAPPLGDFDGDGLADLLISRDSHFYDFDPRSLVASGKVPLLLQALSGKTGRRMWVSSSLPLPDWIRPTDADEMSASWRAARMSELRPSLACMLDLNDDGRPEVLSVFGLASHRYPNAQDSSQKHRQQQFLALFDGRDGALQWAEPFTDLVIGEGWSFSAGDNLRWDASADLNGDGTRDFVLVSPKQNENRGWWSGELQARSGRDGKLLWTPQQLEGLWDDPAALKQPIVSDLDGDGHPEIVQLETTHPHIRVFRGDTGEPLWSWQAPQNLSQMVSSVVTVGRRLGTLARPDLPSTSKDEKGTGKSAHPTRLVAVTIYETGANAELVLLDHTGKVAERVPTQGNWPIWSYDLDGDGAEELLRWAGNKIQATHGLHELLWDWSPPPYGSHSISYFERAADGRAVVAVTSGDALLMLDGSTGKPLGRTWKSCNTPLNENGRNVKLNRLKLNSAGESPRLVTRVGDGSALLNHVVSRAVLPTSADGRYELGGRGSRRADGDETARIPKISSAEASPSRARGMAVDPRLVRQLPWAPSPRERSESIWIMLLMQTARAIMLSLMIVLIPFWMIRTGVRSRELGRWRGVVIVAGLAVIALSIAALQSLTPSPGMGGLPLGVKLAMAFGALPILAWPTTMLRSVFLGEWRRLMWLFGGSLLVAVVLAAILLATGSAKMPPEQHYSWHGWWFILLIGAYAVGGLLVVWRVVGPGVCWLWNFGRRKLVRHA